MASHEPGVEVEVACVPIAPGFLSMWFIGARARTSLSTSTSSPAGSSPSPSSSSISPTGLPTAQCNHVLVLGSVFLFFVLVFVSVILFLSNFFVLHVLPPPLSPYSSQSLPPYPCHEHLFYIQIVPLTKCRNIKTSSRVISLT